MGRTLDELARHVGGEVVGDPGRPIERLRPLALAGEGDLSFLSSRRYLRAARSSRASALVVGQWAPSLAVDRIVVADPAQAVATLVELFHPRSRPLPGIHPTAVVDPAAEVAATATVGPYVVVGAGARIGARSVISAHVVIGERVTVGEDAWLHPHVVIYPGTRLAARVEVHAGSVLGADGFAYASSREGHRKVPQVGALDIGGEVEIGALSAIDRGALDDTRIGAGSKIDNLVQVGHNVQVGENVLLCGQVGVAGSARLGPGVVLAGQVGVADHLEVGAGARVAAKSAVLQDVPPGQQVAGIPAIELREWHRRRALEGRLRELWRRVRALSRGRDQAAADADDEGGDD